MKAQQACSACCALYFLSSLTNRLRHVEIVIAGAAIGFDDLHFFRVLMALGIEPASVIESGRLDNERISIPSSYRIPQPAG